MYKLLIVTKSLEGVASSVAEFNSQESADKAFKAIIANVDCKLLLTNCGLHIVVIKLYLRA
jgi:hypothetical protein